VRRDSAFWVMNMIPGSFLFQRRYGFGRAAVRIRNGALLTVASLNDDKR